MSEQRPPLSFGSRPAPGRPRAREVKAWVRAAAGLPETATVVVTELSCSEPGCPPYEVVMAVLAGGQPPVQRKLHCRLAELSEEEVVRAWTTGDGRHPAHHPDDDHKEE